ncbi:hypothetical protein QBC37DRAFT_431623 [Rhypophila decipiens]|uniref:Uncharacterized protein n=1 Tax=Rhypophila decipiens TaxID=261697 RepID=A0AAN6XZX4_9PEZI|nr:hypothetical protein QBC37DRAFT_431623 [Rhypophila decipiens]
MPSFIPQGGPLRAGITLILGLCTLYILCVTARAQMHQQPLFGHPPTTPISDNRTYSVSFHLASSYGAAAVIISGDSEPDANLQTYTFTTAGSDTYKSTMSRLSLHSSEHLAPPYDSMQDYFDDVPRALARRALKRVGLPSSGDVGSLSTVIVSLVEQIRSALNITVADAVITSTHLHALYQDDLYDIAQYARFQYVEPKRLYQPMLWETGAACAGHGLNLCRDFRNTTACYDEDRTTPVINVLEVHYSATALTSSIARMYGPTSAFEDDTRRVEDFKLGGDARAGYKGGDEQYWSNVKEVIIRRMLEYQATGRPDLVILTGDENVDNDKFRAVLDDALKEIMGPFAPPPWVLDDDAMVIAAKGAAELRRRGVRVPKDN